MSALAEATQKQLLLFRTLSLLGGLFVLGFGLLNRVLRIAFLDPLPERIFIGLALLLFFGLTFFSRRLREQARF